MHLHARSVPGALLGLLQPPAPVHELSSALSLLCALWCRPSWTPSSSSSRRSLRPRRWAWRTCEPAALLCTALRHVVRPPASGCDLGRESAHQSAPACALSAPAAWLWPADAATNVAPHPPFSCLHTPHTLPDTSTPCMRPTTARPSHTVHAHTLLHHPHHPTHPWAGASSLRTASSPTSAPRSCTCWAWRAPRPRTRVRGERGIIDPTGEAQQ